MSEIPSRVTYVSNGSTTTFNVPFPYISKAYVYAVSGGSQLTFTWDNPSTIRLSSAITAGQAIVVYRKTPGDVALVDFQNGDALLDSDLDLATLQSIHIAQEARDQSLTYNSGTEFDAQGRRIINVATPTADTDAANKGYLNERLATVTWQYGAIPNPTAPQDKYILTASGAGTWGWVAPPADDQELYFATRAAAIAATIPAFVNRVTVLGYTTRGDKGGGEYKRVAAQPSHLGRFQSVDGTWWELDVEFSNPRQFGAVGNGSTIDTAALSAANDYGQPLTLLNGDTYRLAASLTLTVPIYHRGGKISVDAAQTLTVSGKVISLTDGQMFSGAGEVAGLEWADIRWFGATVGAVDCSPYLQKTYNASRVTYIPPTNTNFTITAGIDCNLPEKQIVGALWLTELTLGAGAAAATFRITQDNIKFSGIKITGNKSQTNYLFLLGTSVRSVSYINIEDFETNLCANFISDENHATNVVTNLYMRRVYHKQPVGRFCYLTDCFAFIFFDRVYADYFSITAAEFDAPAFYIANGEGIHMEETEVSGGDVTASLRDAFWFSNCKAVSIRRGMGDTMGNTAYRFETCDKVYLSEVRGSLCNGYQFYFYNCTNVTGDIYAYGRKALSGAANKHAIYFLGGDYNSLTYARASGSTGNGIMIENSNTSICNFLADGNTLRGYVHAGTGYSRSGGQMIANVVGNASLNAAGQHLYMPQYASAGLGTYLSGGPVTI